MADSVAISEVRANLPELIDKIHARFDRAVLSVEETAKVLKIARITEDIKKSRKQFKNSQFISLKDL